MCGAGERGDSWFNDHNQRELSEGVGILFWWDPQLERDTLKSQFSCLFDLSNYKLATVSDMFLLSQGERGDAWRWRRCLLA